MEKLAGGTEERLLLGVDEEERGKGLSETLPIVKSLSQSLGRLCFNERYCLGILQTSFCAFALCVQQTHTLPHS